METAERRPLVVMIGMHLTRTRGGITTLIRNLLASPLKDRFDLCYIPSQAEDALKPGKIAIAVRAALRCLWTLLRHPAALVYVHVGSNASLYRESLFVPLAKLFGVRALVHFHAGDVSEYLEKQPRVGKAIIKFCLSLAYECVAVSNASAQDLCKLLPSAVIEVLPNAIDLSELLAIERPRSGSAPRVLFVGAVGKLKGETDLLAALARLSSDQSQIRFSILGFGAEMLADEIRRLGLEEGLEHLGPVSFEERIDHYRKADIFVLPTYAEAMPVSVMEAMAAGLAVLTTRVGGIPEILDDGAEGILIEPGNVDGLKLQLEKLIRDRELRLRLGRNARKRMAGIDLQEFHRRLGRCIDRVIAEPAGSGDPKLLAKRVIKSSAGMLGLGSTRRPAGAVKILAYHRVVSDIRAAERDAYYGLSVSAATFRRHCEALASTHNVVSLDEAAQALGEGNRNNGPLAAITFDDGYVDFYEVAYPILRELGLPATVFVPTGCIGRSEPLAHDKIYWLIKYASEKRFSLEAPLIKAGIADRIARRFRDPEPELALVESLVYLPHRLRENVISEIELALPERPDYPKEYSLLDWEMLAEMTRGGMTVGAHTVNHVVLPLETRDDQEKEIVESRQEIERRIGREAVSFAYPNGRFDQSIHLAVRNAGYTLAVTTENRLNRRGDDLLSLGRISLSEESTRGITGGYEPAVARLRLGIS